MDDMLMSANEAILSTKTSVDGFSLGIANLLASVGALGFLGILASLFLLGLGVGSLGFSGVGRIDEYFLQPLIARIRGEDSADLGIPLDERSLQKTTPLLSLLEEAYNLYHRGNS